jgi:hypothetical protein
MKLLIVAATVVLAGCASTQTKVAHNQYCYTYQTIETENKESVNSKTTVKCSDDPIEKFIPARTGVGKNCGEFTYWMTLAGRPVQRRGFACQKYDGTYEIVPHAFN